MSTNIEHICKDMPKYIDIVLIGLYNVWYLFDHTKRLVKKGLNFCPFCGKKLSSL